MGKKTLTLSIVIPVYNEERHLKACLERIAVQTLKPVEVIIVDNNSTDKSIQIARRYKFVKIIKEPRQSQVYAQAVGFDAAQGDIIGRIDGDTYLPAHWAEAVTSYFQEHPGVVGITGSALPYDIYMKRVGKYIQIFYHDMANLIAGKKMLWGANAALRRSTWRRIRSKVNQRPDIWEDFDISFPLNDQGQVDSVRGIQVGLSFRAVQKPFKEQFQYQFRAVRTFWLRVGLLRAFIFSLVWTTELLVYPLTVADQYILSPMAARRFKAKRRQG